MKSAFAFRKRLLTEEKENMKRMGNRGEGRAMETRKEQKQLQKKGYTQPTNTDLDSY